MSEAKTNRGKSEEVWSLLLDYSMAVRFEDLLRPGMASGAICDVLCQSDVWFSEFRLGGAGALRCLLMEIAASCFRWKGLPLCFPLSQPFVRKKTTPHSRNPPV
ncbi:MAG: hypothetical protein D6704_04215 [Nitrospirae bacterium]|nr:MAG: hypothetical protein D6704_04215 [Nitrospirota bacterium]